jgi:hypothetical protein
MKLLKNKFLLCLIALVATANVASADCSLGSKIKEGYYIISSTVNKNFCIDVKKGIAADKQNIQLYHSNGTKAQKWYFESAGDDAYYIRSAIDRNYVLAMKNNAGVEGNNVELARFTGSKAQRWYLQKIGKGMFYIRSYVEYMMILDFSGRPADNVNIKLGDFFNEDVDDSTIWSIHK